LKKNLNIIIIALVFSAILWISITLSDEFYSTINLPVRVIDAPAGYTVATDLPKNISVKIKGIGWRLTGISLGSESYFNVSARNDSGMVLSNLYANIINNPWLSSDLSVIDISPDTVSFVIEKITSRKLPVIPDLKLDFKTGYGLSTKFTLTPDSVNVSGPKSLINSLESLKTQSVKLSQLDSQTKVKASFENSKLVTDVPFVEIFLDVQRIVDKTVDNIRVEVIDVPADRDVVLIPNSISCLVKGGINILGRLTENDFRAYVHYRDVLLDSLGAVQPIIEFPENIEIVTQRPDRLRYIIKKFD